MSREQFVAALERIRTNVQAIEERRQKNLDDLLVASRSFTHDMLEQIDRLKSQAIGEGA